MTRKQLLELCESYVTKDREADHGAPEDSFGLIARYWSVYLGKEVSPADVASLMVLLKVARGQYKPTNTDNWVDIAGYAACGCELATGKEPT